MEFRRIRGTDNCTKALFVSALAVAFTGFFLTRTEARPSQVQDPILPTTLRDFFLQGTQSPGEDFPIEIEPFVGVMEGGCINCHGNFVPKYTQAEQFRNWAGSMMAQAARDPLFYAALTVANQDAAFSGDMCLRCHSPSAWLEGRSLPTDGSGLSRPADFEGESCHFCHRIVNPVYIKGESPNRDITILDDLEALGLLPKQYGSGRYVIDPQASARRGPRDGINHPRGEEAIYSPFHSKGDFCGTCHDVSNPALSRQEDGSYLPNELDAPHPTGSEQDMFPIERTYSEWRLSTFANGGVQMDGRFGGNHETGVMETCQDCHMPDQVGPGSNMSEIIRPDAPQHAFNGGNTWVLKAVRDLYPDSETGLTDEIVADTISRTIEFLEKAADLELAQEESILHVRIINYSAHKLPTGYPDGRRMWLNVQFLDDANKIIQENGAYDFNTASLNTEDTKVYEINLGLDQAMSDITGVPAGESFHFVLNNTRLKDNRIPPMGFSNDAFEAVQAEPVAYTYDDGQHWDDTFFEIPKGAVRADVKFYYQSTSREYIEFLLTENTTDTRSQILYDQWLAHGMSEPVPINTSSIIFENKQTSELTGFEIVSGMLLDGTLAELLVSDDAYIHTRSGFGRTFIDLHNMEMIVNAVTTVDAPITIDLTIESRVDEPAGLAQIRLYNWNTGQFQAVGSYSIGNTDQVDVIAGIDAANYVNSAGNGEIDLSLKHLVFVPFLAFTFESFIDEVLIEVN